MDALDKARKLLENVTPMRADCGKLCQAACCQPSQEEENGMLLFPGEARYYEGASWCRLIPHGSTQLLVCEGRCPRENRPLACRMFPLVTLPGGRAPLDVRAWPVCPLMPSGRRGLREDFVLSVKEAARILEADPAQKAFMEELEHLLDTYRAPW
ncbi:MAG: hypothetical protein IJ461_04970 [Clostridia bacterium]|nr:hypothetical protein [Clostridia bacterium]